MRQTHKGFTLLELLIVVAIVITLVTVLLVAVIPALSAGSGAKTTDLFTSIDDAITRWRSAEGKANDAAPKSGKNSIKSPYGGNLLLYRALVLEPERKGKDPYIKVDEEMVGYLSEDGKSVTATVDKNRAIFLDGFGQPIVYWEWASKTRTVAGGDPTESGTRRTDPKELKLARNKGSYDLFSSGEDLQLGTSDDVTNGGHQIIDSPFKAKS